MVEGFQNAESGALPIGRKAIKNAAIELGKKSRKVIQERLPNSHAFLQFDGWDGVEKMLGFSLSYVFVNDSKELCHVVTPVGFEAAEYDPETDKMTSTNEMKEKIESNAVARHLRIGWVYVR